MRLPCFLICFLVLSINSLACFCGFPKPLTARMLTKYPYVALVKIKTLEKFAIPGSDSRRSRTAKFTVDVIENFKQALPDTFILESYLTSCDIGLRPGQTWVILAREVKGYATVFACDYSSQCYGEQPVSDYGNRRSQLAEELLNTIRQLIGKLVKAAGGRIEKAYASGQRALLTVYRPNGREERLVWYANGQLQGKEFYKNGLKNGPSTWWNANRTPLAMATFGVGIAVDTSRSWYNTDTDALWLQSTPSLTDYARESIIQFSKRSHIQSVTIADRRGRLLNSRIYDWHGRLIDETIGVPETGVECCTSYDQQGNVNFLIVTRTVPSAGYEPTRKHVYRIDYEKNSSRQIAYYDNKGRLIRWVSVKNGIETVLEEKHYPD